MSSAAKTLLLWVVLIALFIFFYWYFGPTGSPQPATRPKDNSLIWVPIVVAAIAVAIAYSRFQASRPWRKQYDQALSAFNRGRFAEAVELWTLSFERASWKPAVRFNIGSARINLWQLSRAHADLHESIKLAESVKQTQLLPMAYAQLAFIDALKGDVAASRAATAKATKTDASEPIQLLTEAVLLLREGRVDEAQRALRSSEMRQITGRFSELVRVLDSFCVFLRSGELRHVDKVGLYQEAAPTELLRAWPELAAFLDKAPQS